MVAASAFLRPQGAASFPRFRLPALCLHRAPAHVAVGCAVSTAGALNTSAA